MALTKYQIGDLIKPVEERNSDGSISAFYGININKEFMPTVANVDSVDPRKYLVLRKNRFVYSGMQTGRDECIRIGLYTKDAPIIVSPAYTTFEVTNIDTVLPEYFFMLFLSKEMDRYGAFLSDSSIRANLDWERFCEIEVDLPSIPVQEKFVAVYNAMKANQAEYERGLDDLKLTCDAYIEELKRDMPLTAIGEFIEQSDDRNGDKYDIEALRGISIQKCFIDSKADMTDVSLSPYLLVPHDHFAYVTVTSRNGEKITLAHNATDNTYIVSSSYIVFRVKDTKKLLPAYLMMFFSRSEFDRYTRFNSWGSARETFGWDEMQAVKIPIPDIKIQQSIADIFNAYLERREINERLKRQLRDLCPILIKGSLQAA